MKLKKLLAAATMLAAYSGVFAQGTGLHVINTFHIPSPGRWDYIAVSPVGENIYVSHQTQVNILNKSTGDSTGVILNTTGVHGIAFAAEFKKGFITNGKLNTVTVFDINSNAVLAQVKTGDNPDAILYDPFSKKVYVCNGHSNDLTLIDPLTNEPGKTISLGGKPEMIVSDGAGRIFINIEDKNEIAMINTRTLVVEKHWKLGKGEAPSGLAIDAKTKRLFSGCENKLLIVMNAENGKVVKSLPIGEGCDGVAFDPSWKYIYSSNGEGTLTVIHEKSANDFEVLENLTTRRGARTLAVDERTHKVYLPTADFANSVPREPAQKHPDVIPGTFQVLVVGK